MTMTTAAMQTDFQRLTQQVPDALGLFDTGATDTGSPNLTDFCYLRPVTQMTLNAATTESGSEPVLYTGMICTSISTENGEQYTHMWTQCLYHRPLRDRHRPIRRLYRRRTTEQM